MLNIVPFSNAQAIDTNESSTPWTMQKAEHLARKALFWATPEKVQELYNAWSATNAVDILFPSISWPDKTTYINELNSITWDLNFSYESSNNMAMYYFLKKYLDPYEAKQKLFLIFEDTFSVNRDTGKDITYSNIEATHDLLYSHTLWNYKEMIKRNLYNNWNPWDYSAWAFLDLFNQTNPTRPNENYWRELLQLFLMLEYKSTESENNWDTRNYTETDVNMIARMLVWMKSDDITKQVSYDNNVNDITDPIYFLTGALKTWDSFPFYNSASGSIDIQTLKNPIAWNNWLPDNIIDYIFSKREDAIALFLADKLYRFYVAENPTKSELDQIATQIKNNSFEIYPSVKWLLASDLMYTDKSMNGIIYKNPMELTLGTYKLLKLDTDDIKANYGLYNLWTYLAWSSYFPGSIFWRDWFDENDIFFTEYTENQWITRSSLIPNYININDFVQTRITYSNFMWAWTIFDTLDFVENKSYLDLSPSSIYLSWTLNLSNIIVTNSFDNVTSYTWWSLDFENRLINLDNWDILNINIWNLDYNTEVLSVSSWSLEIWMASQSIKSVTMEVEWTYAITRDIIIPELITQLENKLLLWRKIDSITENKIINYLTTDSNWNPTDFLISDTTYQRNKVKWVLHMFLVLPEYILQSWYDLSESTENNTNDFYGNDNSKLVMIELPGWYDWLHGVIPKAEYDTYLDRRWVIAKTWTGILNLNNDYYINSALSSFKSLFDSWDLKVFNRNWTIYHSRWHDSAMRKSTSEDSIEDPFNPWIIWNLLRDSDPGNTVVLGTTKPNILRDAKYLSVWSSWADFENYSQGSSAEKNMQLDTIKSILNWKTYPARTKAVFTNSIKINDVAKDSVANWWRDWAWYNLANNLSFVNSLLTNNVWNLYHMRTWGYDTHSNQVPQLDNRLKYVADSVKDFYDSVKNNHDVTIVVYSEFGRTTRVNESAWTDHGMGGWIFMITNNSTLKTELPENVYGNISIEKEPLNYLWVGIDYRAIYSRILYALYWKDISSSLWWEFILEEYTDSDTPKVELFRKEFEHYSNNDSKPYFSFKINDWNFIASQASYIKFEYWTDPNNLREESKYNIDIYMIWENNEVKLYIRNIIQQIQYYYKITVYDNQYNETVIEGNFIAPEIKDTNWNQIATDTMTRLRKYNNTSFSWSLSLANMTSSWIILSNSWTTIINWENWIKLLAGSWTYISDLTTWSGITTWNGTFVIPQLINKGFFITENSEYNSQKLSQLKIEKLIKVWADKLWVGMKLNRNVTIQVPWLDTTKSYGIIYSEDGETWERHETNLTRLWTNFEFTTNHFTYFAIIETDSNWNFVENNTWVGNNSDSNENSIKTVYSGWGWSILRKDVCPYWDYSESYYDKTCWEDPLNDIAMWDIEDSEIYMMQKAIEQLEQKEEKKATIYKELFDIKIDSDISSETQVLKLLREWLSTVDINWYSLIYIKKSKYNSVFKWLAEYLLSKKYKSLNTKEKLIEKLNEAIIYFAIYKLHIDTSIKSKAKSSFKNSLSELVKIYNKEKTTKKSTIIKATETKEEVKVENNDTQKQDNEERAKETEKVELAENKTEEKVQTNNEISNSNTDTKSSYKVKNIEHLYNSKYVYQVWVPYVELKADLYWKETNAYLYKWDIVEQITTINKIWFFKVKVLGSVKWYEWVEGYIYLKNLTK